MEYFSEENFKKDQKLWLFRLVSPRQWVHIANQTLEPLLAH
jgi:hypothetical protein